MKRVTMMNPLVVRRRRRIGCARHSTRRHYLKNPEKKVLTIGGGIGAGGFCSNGWNRLASSNYFHTLVTCWCLPMEDKRQRPKKSAAGYKSRRRYLSLRPCCVCCELLLEELTSQIIISFRRTWHLDSSIIRCCHLERKM